MESQKRYKLFRRFLRENGCSEAFDRNFEAAHPGYILNEPMSCLIGIDYGTFGRVFRWDLTPEGRPYWKEIADAWCDLFAKYCHN